jgi:exodeoxyribonuclease V gamma subunit
MLVGVLGDLLAEPLADPMAREVVAVPTRGVERWLSQRLSHRLGAGTDAADGVCANIAWPFPGALVEMATAAAAGVPVGPDWLDGASVDPWSPRRLVWPLLQVVDESLDEEFLRPLAEHLRASCTAPAGQAPRRFATVRHLADLYDRYAVHRPDMLLGWLDGEAGPCGAGSGPETDDATWQAELWRRLRGRVGVPSLAERLAAAPAALAAQPEILPLPKRLSVFGLTRLPASHLRVLDAIAAHRDVHLLLLHPSGQLWEKVEGWLGSRQSRAQGPMARRDDPTIALPQNPLLRSWGRDSREMQVVLASQGLGGGEHVPVPEAARTPTLLQLIQRDIRADREPPGPPPRGADDRRPLISSADHSVQVHSCHGRARQVEVVREAVLHLLARDSTLEPRDVIVMCPDIELFAPLVTAAFGTASPERGPELRAKLADRSLRQTNPLLAVASHLLDLAGGRATAPQLLDFASREPVSRRFGLGEEDLSRIEEWVVRTGTRWGFDDAHRENWHLGRLGGLATWQRGLDRLLLGIAMGGATEPFGGVLPLDYVASTDIALAGRFVELVARLQATMEQLSAPRPAAAWATALLEGTEKLACAGRGDEWQHDQLRHVLTQVAQLATPASDPPPAGSDPPPAGSDPPAGHATTAPKPGGGPTERLAHGPAGPLLDLSEARALLADSLRGQPTRANFRTGDLTICTLVPMRSVPHRVVCLLGLDDGLFPRPARQDGDNLLLVEPQVGERDEPSEDRQLLLDALLAAKDHLVITYEGRDQRLNRKLPAAVPVAELLDVIDRTVRHPDPAVPAREMVMVEHPLQAFDPRNYLSGGLGVAGPWRFDGLNLEGARSLAGERHPKAPFLESRLAPISQKMLSLRSLVLFLEFPVRAFLRERVGYYTRRETERLSDSIPLDLDALEGWALGDRLLSALFAGATTEEALAAERGRGLLPLGQLGEDALRSTLQDAASLFVAAQSMEAFSEPAVPVEINVELPDGRQLVGTVPDVRKGTIARCTFSKLRPKQRLQAWAHLLALSAAHPELAPSSVTVGRSESSKSGATRTCTQWLAPLGGDTPSLQPAALEKLSVLVDLYDRGMREPLPLYCATSAAWAAAARVKGDPREAEAAWGTKSNRGWGEAFEPEHVLVLGEALAFEKVLKDIPRHDEAGPGWPTQEKSRFGRLAVRLWGPVLEHEKLEVG